MYTIDRVQFAETYNQYFFFEFMEVENINLLLNNHGQIIHPDYLWSTLFGMVSNIEEQKLILLRDMQQVNRIFIFYQRGLDTYIKIELTTQGRILGHILSFIELRDWLKWLNNIDGQGYSKGLGAARDADLDNYVNGLLQSLYEDNQFQDDNGLELTKQLLDGDATKGFDFDLFQFIPSTGEYIIYEFLKRENSYINNIQANPMRYCWTGKWNDNKQKFISLWNAKQFFNGRLFLINYSDDVNEKISIVEILKLDIEKGIMAEKKYCMSKNIFLGWLKDMDRYNSTGVDYLSDFKCVEYDETFFENFNTNKRTYGTEFTNIYL